MFSFIALTAFPFISAISGQIQQENSQIPEKTFTLWQLPSQTHSQIMSYVIKTANGKIIVIDGGTSGDAIYLKDFLKQSGNVIEMWIITHPHKDHMNALKEILKYPDGMKIKGVYASLNDVNWIRKYSDKDEIKNYNEFMETLSASNRLIEQLDIGQIFNVDGVYITILGIKNPEITHNAINNSSVVLGIQDGKKSILFLSDLGVKGGNKLLQNKELLKYQNCDYIQMAHHGQRGVSKEFYTYIKPHNCLWPTTRWLWENDSGQGKGSGSWRTLEVRTWMTELNVKSHYCSFKDAIKIE